MISEERQQRQLELENKVLLAAYGLEEFTISEVAEAAGGPHLYTIAQRLLRDRFLTGEIIKVKDRRPIVYAWKPE